MKGYLLKEIGSMQEFQKVYWVSFLEFHTGYCEKLAVEF